MTTPSEEGLADHIALIKYIASIDASLLESRSLGGFTPLHLACTRRAKDDIALLISLGSKVRSRDSTGRNMIHHLICAKDKPEWKEGESLDTFLSLFEKSDVTEMLLERDILGYTPFAFWQSECGTANSEITHASTVPETVSAYTDGQHLTIMNSVGDLPLHVAIKQGRPLHVREFIAQNPQTLDRENATGITALELAQQKLASAALEGIRTSLLGSNRYSGRNNETAVLGVETFDYHKFEPKEPVPEDKRERMKVKLLKGEMQSFETHRWVSEECLEAVERLEAAGETLKRRLVPLGEANEVARRMVVAQKKDEQWRIQQYHFSSTDEDRGEHINFDEVAAAMSSRAEQGWVLRGRAVVNIV
jgi:hypothetical protein